jgi:hypothetical protein
MSMWSTFIETPIEVSGSTPEQESIRWTRRADGSYGKTGSLPAEISTARIFSIDEDFQTNRLAVCPGLRMRPKEEAIALVERKIQDGSYGGWRYEIRPELDSTDNASQPLVTAPSSASGPRKCKNQRCRRGLNGTPAIVPSRRAKYCSPSCRVAVSRREAKPMPKSIEERKRKRRSDAKHQSNAQRQRAYRVGLEERRRSGMRLHLPSSVTDNQSLQPA